MPRQSGTPAPSPAPSPALSVADRITQELLNALQPRGWMERDELMAAIIAHHPIFDAWTQLANEILTRRGDLFLSLDPGDTIHLLGQFPLVDYVFRKWSEDFAGTPMDIVRLFFESYEGQLPEAFLEDWSDNVRYKSTHLHILLRLVEAEFLIDGDVMVEPIGDGSWTLAYSGDAVLYSAPFGDEKDMSETDFDRYLKSLYGQMRAKAVKLRSLCKDAPYYARGATRPARKVRPTDLTPERRLARVRDLFPPSAGTTLETWLPG